MGREFKSLSIDEVHDIFAAVGLPKFRAGQVLSWVYGKGISSYEEMTNLPKAMRQQLDEEYPLHTPETSDIQISSDGSRKYLLRFHDGAFAETVGLPSEGNKLTVCVSSQSGCAMSCAFCATGKQGLTRSLLPGEIADQVLSVQEDFSMRATNVVVMGQGEPFANYDEVLSGLRILNAPKLLGIGARHITVSTCGLVKGIERFSREGEQFTLAVSLHSAIQEKRDMLMPAMSSQGLDVLKASLGHYVESTGRRFSFEYALMEGINDGDEDLDALIGYCKGQLCHVNLIPLNAVPGSPFKPVSPKLLHYWKTRLENSGTAASVRRSRGSDIAAACGQLASVVRNSTE